MDCLYEEEQEAVVALFTAAGLKDVLCISALENIGIEALKERLGTLLEMQEGQQP
jgi:predicted GTPase